MKFKGPALRALDAWYSTGSVAKNLDDARNLLQSGASFPNIIATLNTQGHGNSQFVYPKHPEVQGAAFETLARQRYLHAIDLAQRKNPNVPIKSCWETEAGNAQFQIDVDDLGSHIEVTIRVPNAAVDPGDATLGLSDVHP